MSGSAVSIDGETAIVVEDVGETVFLWRYLQPRLAVVFVVK